MSKDRIVLLVSRAIAVIQCISALEEITYLPGRLLSLHHYSRSGSSIGTDYFSSIQSLELSMLFLRIAGLLTLTWVFWQCGPWISKLLFPHQKNHIHAGHGVPEGGPS